MVANLQEQNKRLSSRLNERTTGQEAAIESKFLICRVEVFISSITEIKFYHHTSDWATTSSYLIRNLLCV